MALRLDGKVAVVTGSSSGIGRSIATAFASQGAKLVICSDIRPNCCDVAETALDSVQAVNSNQATHELICKLYGEGSGIFIRCDVSLGVGEEKQGEPLSGDVHSGQGSVETVKGVHIAIEEAVRIGGRLDILVNNAGFASFDTKLHETTEAQWDKSMSVHARGTFLGSRCAAKQFLSQDTDLQGERGTIINVSSVGGGIVGLVEGSAYCASKAAIVGLTRAVAVEYAARGIRCNAICPGYINTSMLAPYLVDADFSSYLDIMIPARHIGKPRDIAGAAVWLASGNESGYVNGIVLPVDGGASAK